MPEEILQEDPQWFFETPDDESDGIETKKYSNGQVMKRAKLSDGRSVVVRRLKGKDAKDLQRLMGGSAEQYQLAVMATCTTIDDQKVIMEEIEQMWLDDYTLLTSMAAINFPITQK